MLEVALPPGSSYEVSVSLDGTQTIDGQERPWTADLRQSVSLSVTPRSGASSVEPEVTSSEGDEGARGFSPLSKGPFTLGPDGRIDREAAPGLDALAWAFPPTDQLVPILPAEPVSPGDTWSIDLDYPIGPAVIVHNVEGEVQAFDRRGMTIVFNRHTSGVREEAGDERELAASVARYELDQEGGLVLAELDGVATWDFAAIYAEPTGATPQVSWDLTFEIVIERTGPA